MTKRYTYVVEYKYVEYTNMPRMIGILKAKGFNLDDITIIRISPVAYKVSACKSV